MSSWPKSIGYAIRGYVARKKRHYLDNVTIYYAQTQFQRRRLIEGGLHSSRVYVIPNMVDPRGLDAAVDPGNYVGYVGRISPEKGIETLRRAATQLSGVTVRMAGSFKDNGDLTSVVPENLLFDGHLERDVLAKFYESSRMLVLPSLCYEGFPAVLIEAGIRGKPVICSRIGGLPEIVDDGVTGLLFEPGNAEDLAEKIRYLWERPDLCRQMGQAGREKVLREYTPQRYYERLMAVFKKAIELGPGGPGVAAN